MPSSTTMKHTFVDQFIQTQNCVQIINITNYDYQEPLGILLQILHELAADSYFCQTSSGMLSSTKLNVKSWFIKLWIPVGTSPFIISQTKIRVNNFQSSLPPQREDNFQINHLDICCISAVLLMLMSNPINNSDNNHSGAFSYINMRP